MKVRTNTANDNIKRLNEFYKVLKKNDFGYLIEENTFFKKFLILLHKLLLRSSDDLVFIFTTFPFLNYRPI